MIGRCDIVSLECWRQDQHAFKSLKNDLDSYFEYVFNTFKFSFDNCLKHKEIELQVVLSSLSREIYSQLIEVNKKTFTITNEMFDHMFYSFADKCIIERNFNKSFVGEVLTMK